MKSSGSIGQAKRVFWPIVTGSAIRIELRLEESIIPLVTRHCVVTFSRTLVTSMKHPVSSGTDSPQQERVTGFELASPSLVRVVWTLAP